MELMTANVYETLKWIQRNFYLATFSQFIDLSYLGGHFIPFYKTLKTIGYKNGQSFLNQPIT